MHTDSISFRATSLLGATAVVVMTMCAWSCDGATQDNSQAGRTARAEQGDATAQCELGVMYAKGDGVPKDSAQAFKWYTMAAEQGHATAQCALGVMYAKGDGVPKDSARAFKWYTTAAEQGHATAQCRLSMIYHFGEPEIAKNAVLAYSWANIAAANADKTARELRDRAEAGMTREQVAEAQRISAAFKPVAEQASKD